MFKTSENTRAYVSSGATRKSFNLNSRLATIEHTVNPPQPRLTNKQESSQNIVFISKFNQEDDLTRLPRNQPRMLSPSTDTDFRSTPPSVPQKMFKLTRDIQTREKNPNKSRPNFSNNNFYYHYYDKVDLFLEDWVSLSEVLFNLLII
jgi:hypothetical protein